MKYRNKRPATLSATLFGISFLAAACTQKQVPMGGDDRNDDDRGSEGGSEGGAGGSVGANEPAAEDAAAGRASATGGAPAAGGAGGKAGTGGMAPTDADAGTGGQVGGPLQLYWIDVEGGAATLIVTPGGETVLADTGWPGARDATRIAQVVRNEAKRDKIDYVIVTHYHVDHVGGAPDLVKAIGVTTFVDHGASVEAGGDNAYKPVAEGKRKVVMPGDTLPLTGVTLTIVSARGEVIATPLPGAANVANPNCQNAQMRNKVPSDENSRSVGYVVSMGKFSMMDLGDLLWGNEHDLACPTNKVGQIDLYQVTHHGFDSSGAPQLVNALDAVAAVMSNGPRKGGANSTFSRLASAPSKPELWQIHRALTSGGNVVNDRIANLEDGAADQAHFIKAVVQPDGSFTITNSRNDFSRTYQSR